MRWIVLGLLIVTSVRAETSKIIPAFLEASSLYVSGVKSGDSGYLKPDIRAALQVLETNVIDKTILEKRTSGKLSLRELPKDDKFDKWVKNSPSLNETTPFDMAVHAVKMKVVEESDDWFKDDIYSYFFITDGVIPTGKVTSIYKGLGQGQSFFFNEIDRAIFPLVGVAAKGPQNHLIIDYGIIESDGDDIKELQKLSSVIIDIAIAVYASYDPQRAQVLINLRKEMKALADLLLGMNHDDRLVTSSFGYKVKELTEMLKDETYVEITKKHHSKETFDSWEYHLTFRFLRN